MAFPGAAPLLDKVSFEERDELEGSLADVVIVDDLRAVPDGFPGLAVTRDGEYYRPTSGQIGLASGVPAALLLERRAASERLGEKLDAVRAREVREETAVALAPPRERTPPARPPSAAAAAEREARSPPRPPERDLKRRCAARRATSTR